MTKKKHLEFILCLVIIWIAVVLQAWSLYRWQEEDKLLEAFDVLDSTPIEGCIEISAPLNKLYLNQKEKKQILEEIAKDLGLGNDYELQKEDAENIDCLVLKKEGEIGSVHLSITTLTVDIGNKNQKLNQYVYVLYRSKKKMDTMLAYKEKIEKVLKVRNLEISSNLNFKGEREGKLSLEEQERLAGKLFHYLKAEEVESVKEEELFTIYGYSDLLKDSVEYGDKEINLNLAFSYEEEEDRTVFYLAMPYLKTDY